MAVRPALLLGANFILNDWFCVDLINNFKNHWRMADPCGTLTQIQPGMIVSDSDDEKLYHHQAAACFEIIQGDTPISDDLQIIGGDGSDSILIPYEETTNDAVIWGLPVAAKRGLIFCDVADIAVDFTGLITAAAEAVVWFVDLDNDSYLGVGHQADDRPGIWSGAADTSILAIQYEANADVTFFENCGAGLNRYRYIYGDKTGVPKYMRDFVDPTGFGRIESEDGMTVFGVGDKGGFFGLATPIVRPAAIADATGAGDVVYRLNDLIHAMENLNLIAS